MVEGGSFHGSVWWGGNVWTYWHLYVIFNTKKYDSKNIGLCRHDGLAVLKNVSGPASEKLKKHLQYLFKQKGLQISIECNLKVVNYLDVTFNLNDGSYPLYRKPNDQTLLHSHPVRSPTIYNQATSTVHWKALITIIIIKRYILPNSTILRATSRQLWI